FGERKASSGSLGSKPPGPPRASMTTAFAYCLSVKPAAAAARVLSNRQKHPASEIRTASRRVIMTCLPVRSDLSGAMILMSACARISIEPDGTNEIKAYRAQGNSTSRMYSRTAEMHSDQYEVMNVDGGRHVKMLTRGVPVEGDAKRQLTNTARMPFIFRHLAVMPDVHVGIGATVGSLVATQGAIIPAGVGVDIGCFVGE